MSKSCNGAASVVESHMAYHVNLLIYIIAQFFQGPIVSVKPIVFITQISQVEYNFVNSSKFNIYNLILYIILMKIYVMNVKEVLAKAFSLFGSFFFSLPLFLFNNYFKLNVLKGKRELSLQLSIVLYVSIFIHISSKVLMLHLLGQLTRSSRFSLQFPTSKVSYSAKNLEQPAGIPSL